MAKIVKGIIFYVCVILVDLKIFDEQKLQPDNDPLEDEEKNELISHCSKLMAEALEYSKYKRSCLDSMKV